MISRHDLEDFGYFDAGAEDAAVEERAAPSEAAPAPSNVALFAAAPAFFALAHVWSVLND